MKRNGIRLSNGGRLALGFAAIIALGTILLYLPVSHRNGESLSFINSLFIATSAVCVTGLTPVDISQVLNAFGTTVMMVLFQIGGLGYAVIASAIVSIRNGQMDLRSRAMLKDSFGADNSTGASTLLKTAMLVVIAVEMLGTLVLAIPFSSQYGIARGIYIALFTSISAFNNAGFDLFSTSLISYSSDPLVIITVSILIVLGGLGFVFYLELFTHRKGSKFSIQSKIIASMTLALILIGFLYFRFACSLDWLDALFQSVTSRTAGFASIDQGTLTHSGMMVTIILMYIGASPGSTGGGIKTTSFFTAIHSSICLLLGREPVLFKRRVSSESVMRALELIAISLIVMGLAFTVLTITDPGIPFENLLFETVSAFATVGLSINTTPLLSLGGRMTIILLMYIGRVGILTIITSFTMPKKQVSYLEERIAIG